MHAARRQTDNNIARRNAFTGDDFFTIDETDGESRQVIIARRVKAGHFRRFPTQKRAAGFLTGRRDTFHNGCDLFRNEFTGRNIVEKEKRTRALHEHVIHAHRHAVLPDRGMFAAINGQPQLGADAIRTGHQHRLFHGDRAQRKKSSETADIAQYSIGIGRLHGVFHQFHRPISRVNIDAGGGIRQCFPFVCGHTSSCSGIGPR